MNAVQPVSITDFQVGGQNPVALIAGPCVLEDGERALNIGRAIKAIANRLHMPYIFKASYDKANRSSYHSFRGPGLEEGLAMLARIKKELGVPVLSDIHCISQVEAAAAVLDVIQIPAFLCRQTDLVYEAARTGKVINVKKGQFLAPLDMKNVVTKIEEAGNRNILLTERGATFGYNNLVVDFRSLPLMRSLGYPVVFDATHSVQLPGGAGTSSGGQREFVPYLTRAAVAAGIDVLFMEVHDNPPEAKSDGPNMLYINQLEDVLKDVLAIDNVIRRHKVGNCL
ncbi:MAG TPA: 3-deoxy-8-phosphooctulonate synthase [Methylomusa anaerophila]|uniref:2-dehydro-3-deoxyphosphooctonate aldolase n=1 Tax=Methylomusa anaerophila TaxID=1930071 RepID=A0A348AKH6_9FIRM|nr:3-deoxy-8-phosphooctulonate synthase [Methylomusa anaerophila]BBB91574.1 2-dehydro-3-deoxyphosphooctonate aldolase [Methylomusa anaerophila]HML89488.1 3-deoxy-8-phosphooctulonate synthase [Methylomusa anaerophila]